jgi:hypothetical protein
MVEIAQNAAEVTAEDVKKWVNDALGLIPLKVDVWHSVGKWVALYKAFPTPPVFAMYIHTIGEIFEEDLCRNKTGRAAKSCYDTNSKVDNLSKNDATATFEKWLKPWIFLYTCLIVAHILTMAARRRERRMVVIYVIMSLALLEYVAQNVVTMYRFQFLGETHGLAIAVCAVFKVLQAPVVLALIDGMLPAPERAAHQLPEPVRVDLPLNLRPAVPALPAVPVVHAWPSWPAMPAMPAVPAVPAHQEVDDVSDDEVAE